MLNEIIRSNTGYAYRVIKYSEINKVAVAVLESEDIVTPFVLVAGFRQLPNRKYVWDSAMWFSSLGIALREYDVERYHMKVEKYQ